MKQRKGGRQVNEIAILWLNAYENWYVSTPSINSISYILSIASKVFVSVSKINATVAISEVEIFENKTAAENDIIWYLAKVKNNEAMCALL